MDQIVLDLGQGIFFQLMVILHARQQDLVAFPLERFFYRRQSVKEHRTGAEGDYHGGCLMMVRLYIVCENKLFVKDANHNHLSTKKTTVPTLIPTPNYSPLAEGGREEKK